jgi:hypothetical protein
VLSFIPVVLFWANRHRAVPILSFSAFALILGTGVVYAPWPARNSLLLGQVMPGSSESTEWLWRGTNPNATGSSWTEDGRTMLDAAAPAFQERVRAASEAERVGIYQEAALTFWRDHPLAALRLYAIKLKSFWLGSDSTGLLYPSAWTVGYSVWYAIMLVFAGSGVWSSWRQRSARPALELVVASLILVSASQALFYVEGRHRLAVEPLLLVLSAGGLVSLVRTPVPWPRRLRDAQG